MAAGRRVAQGVREQVLDHLLDAIRIGHHLIRVLGHRDIHLDLTRAGLVLVPQHDVLEHPLDGEQPRVERAGPTLQPCEIQQVLDDPIEPDGFALDGAEVAFAGDRVEIEIGHLQRFEVATHRGERRPQLVRHVGQHLAARPVGSAQRLVPGGEVEPHAGEGRLERPQAGAHQRQRDRHRVSRRRS